MDAWAAEREALLDEIAERHAGAIRSAEWAVTMACVAPDSGCHRAALDHAERANRFWIRAREALEEHEWERDRPTIEEHRRMAENLIEATALARMDHLLGPGWLEEK